MRPQLLERQCIVARGICRNARGLPYHRHTAGLAHRRIGVFQREPRIRFQVARRHDEVLGHPVRVAGLEGLQLAPRGLVDLPARDVIVDVRGDEASRLGIVEIPAGDAVLATPAVIVVALEATVPPGSLSPAIAPIRAPVPTPVIPALRAAVITPIVPAVTGSVPTRPPTRAVVAPLVAAIPAWPVLPAIISTLVPAVPVLPRTAPAGPAVLALARTAALVPTVVVPAIAASRGPPVVVAPVGRTTLPATVVPAPDLPLIVTAAASAIAIPLGPPAAPGVTSAFGTAVFAVLTAATGIVPVPVLPRPVPSVPALPAARAGRGRTPVPVGALAAGIRPPPALGAIAGTGMFGIGQGGLLVRRVVTCLGDAVYTARVSRAFYKRVLPGSASGPRRFAHRSGRPACPREGADVRS